MGAGIAASPHCAERRICRCSLALVLPPKGWDPASRSWLTSSGVASHPATPSCEEPDWLTRLRHPRVRWSFDRSGLPSECSGPKAFNPSGENHRLFGGPSWDDLYCVPLRSPSPRRRSGAASRNRKIISSGASSRLTTVRTRRSFHCLPAEIGPLVTCRTVLPLPALQRGRDRRPDHPCTMHLVAESRKRKIGAQACG